MVALVHKEQPRGGAPRAPPGSLRAVRRGAEHGLQVHARQRVARLPPGGRGSGAPLDGGSGAAQLLRPRATRIRRHKARGHREQVASKVSGLTPGTSESQTDAGLYGLILSTLLPHTATPLNTGTLHTVGVVRAQGTARTAASDTPRRSHHLSWAATVQPPRLDLCPTPHLQAPRPVNVTTSTTGHVRCVIAAQPGAPPELGA